MSGTVAVIVASYNRPKMLREALASLEGADQIIVADDGSAFDVSLLAAEWVLGPQTPPDERMHRPSCGRLLNTAIRKVLCDYVLVLCDDDLLAPGFLQAAAEALDADDVLHMVRGDWATFNDGETPDPTRLCTFGFEPPLTAGNFVYRLNCALNEDCWWDERSLAVHDGAMLADYIRRHGGGGPRPTWLGYLPLLAGYRREHPNTITNHSVHGGDRYLPSAEALFAAGAGGME